MPIFNIYATIIVSRLFLYFIHERDEKFHNNKNKLFRKRKKCESHGFWFFFSIIKKFGVKLL